MALVAGSLCRYSCKSSCGGTLHDYNVPQKNLEQCDGWLLGCYGSISNESTQRLRDPSQNSPRVKWSAQFSFVRCKAVKQEGHRSSVDGRSEERDLNLELMHAGEVYSNAARESWVRPKNTISEQRGCRSDGFRSWSGSVSVNTKRSLLTYLYHDVYRRWTQWITVYNAIHPSSSAENTPFVKPTVSNFNWDCVRQMPFPDGHQRQPLIARLCLTALFIFSCCCGWHVDMWNVSPTNCDLVGRAGCDWNQETHIKITQITSLDRAICCWE